MTGDFLDGPIRGLFVLVLVLLALAFGAGYLMRGC